MPVLEPSSATYSGKNGKMVEKPTVDISWAKKTIYSVFFHCSSSCARCRIKATDLGILLPTDKMNVWRLVFHNAQEHIRVRFGYAVDFL